ISKRSERNLYKLDWPAGLRSISFHLRHGNKAQADNSSMTPIIHVLVATPLGKGGKGGIDRIMDNLRAELQRLAPKDVAVRFGTTRGQGHILFSALFMILFIARMAWLRVINCCDVLHINLASYGSM